MFCHQENHAVFRFGIDFGLSGASLWGVLSSKAHAAHQLSGGAGLLPGSFQGPETFFAWILLKNLLISVFFLHEFLSIFS